MLKAFFKKLSGLVELPVSTEERSSETETKVHGHLDSKGSSVLGVEGCVSSVFVRKVVEIRTNELTRGGRAHGGTGEDVGVHFLE